MLLEEIDVKWTFPEKNCTVFIQDIDFFEVDPLDFQSNLQ